MKYFPKKVLNKIRYRFVSFLICLSFIATVISGLSFAYNKCAYTVYADEPLFDDELNAFGSYASNEDRDYFLKIMGPLVISDMADNKILASLTLAQAVMETGWGISLLARECKNMFGIRAYEKWNGRVFNSTTKKMYANYTEGSKDEGRLWRVYDSWADSVKDHSTLLNTAAIYKNLKGNFS